MREATRTVVRRAPLAGTSPVASVLRRNARAALVVAHPGHELRLHGWLERVRPRVFVLTDGTGLFNTSRLESTNRVLANAGATAGGIFGRLADRDLYAAILDYDHALFGNLAIELAAALRALDVQHVVGDAAEGYNPGHDVCRLLIDSAVALAARPIARYDFALAGRPDAPVGPGAIARLALSPHALARKIAVAESYPDLVGEVDHARRTFGVPAFARECLRQLPIDVPSVPAEASPPFYEQFGEYQVAAGTYTRVLRYREHMVPLAEALADLTARSAR